MDMDKKQLTKKIEEAAGTPFQKTVWKALLAIPSGETRTYTWVAEKIGRPQSVRAVANAIGANPLAPEVPCHRVLRKDGSLGGYSGQGGIQQKERLLQQEKN